jgi:6-phosphofructokinase
MGRHCGWLALLAGVRYVPQGRSDGYHVDRVLTAVERTSFSSPNALPRQVHGKTTCVTRSEAYVPCPSTILHLTLSQHRQIGKRKTIVIVAEGAHDGNLEPIRADYVKDVLTERLGLDTRVTTLGHTQRGGKPCALDRTLVRYVPGTTALR